MDLSAALDFSGLEAAFAAANRTTGKIIFENYREIKGRDSSILLPWIQEVLSENKIKVSDISEWTVGNGPGSFTGLRIAAALVSGMAFENPSVKARGMSTALCMAASTDMKDGEKALVLFDGRNNEAILCSVKKAGHDFIPDGNSEIHTESSLNSFDFSRFQKICALEKDMNFLKKTVSEKVFSQILTIHHMPVSKLIFNDRNNWTKRLSELEYIRPATLAPTLSQLR